MPDDYQPDVEANAVVQVKRKVRGACTGCMFDKQGRCAACWSMNRKPALCAYVCKEYSGSQPTKIRCLVICLHDYSMYPCAVRVGAIVIILLLAYGAKPLGIR